MVEGTQSWRHSYNNYGGSLVTAFTEHRKVTGSISVWRSETFSVNFSSTHVSGSVCDTVKLEHTEMRIGRFALQNTNQILCILLVYDTTKILTCNILRIIFLFYFYFTLF